MLLYKPILDKIFNLEKIDFDLLRLTSEFSACEFSPENQIFHDETTGEHIQMMIDNFFIHSLENESDAIVLYLSILFHDFRKPQTLSKDENGIYHNIDHDVQGSRYIWDFVYKAIKEGFELTSDKFNLINFASKIIRWHMINDVNRLGNDTLLRFVTFFSILELDLFNEFQKIDHISSKKERNFINFEEKINNIKRLRYKNYNYVYEREVPILNIFVGTPGAGKSFLTKQLLDKNTILISTDSLREEMFGDETYQGKNDEVFGEAQQRIKQLLSFDKKNVIFDATNYSYQLRQNFVKLAQKRQIKIIFYVFLTPYDICVQNNNNRERKIEEERIRFFYENLDMPCGAESQEIKYVFLNEIYTDNFKYYI